MRAFVPGAVRRVGTFGCEARSWRNPALGEVRAVADEVAAPAVGGVLDGEADHWTPTDGQELTIFPIDDEAMVSSSPSMEYVFIRAPDIAGALQPGTDYRMVV